MKRYPLLELCARIEGHEIQRQMLRTYCLHFADWPGLLERAEREGMAPLLAKHLKDSGADFPAPVRRSLNLLCKRHQQQASARLQVLEDVLRLFERHKLTPILLKGAALSLTLYPDPALRPMRDMDILFSRDQVDDAQTLLRDNGFKQSTSPIPADHHHLPSLHKVVDDVEVCIELHRGLYPHCPPWYPAVDFDHLHQTGKRIKVGTTEVTIFNLEETLHYLYQHGFRTPLTYETFKLINAADIIGFTEKYFHEINWSVISERFPLLEQALPLMHHISPWDFDRISEDVVAVRNRTRRFPPVPFGGWPRKRRKELQAKKGSLPKVLLDTFLPSRWWLGIYYGAVTTGGWFRCVLWKHPRHVYWWAKLLSYR